MNVKNIKKYTPGFNIHDIQKKYKLKKVIKLASNENPFISEDVLSFIKKSNHKLNLYPDSNPDVLHKLLANTVGHRMTAKNIILGNGSNEILEFIVRANVDDKSEVIIPKHSFLVYEIISKLQKAKIITTKPNSDKASKNYLGINLESVKEKITKKTSAKIATIVGRYYAMDRDNRWDRTKIAYDLITNSIGERSRNIVESIKKSYDLGISDEFLKPIVMENEYNQPIAKIEEEDVVVFFNFRTDRCRQLTKVISQKSIKELNLNPLKLHLLTMTNYDNSFSNINIIFDKENIKETIGEILAREGKIQIRIAETEKYPHVTFFFNGGRENPFSGEERILCPSPKVATYDLQPEMSAYEIKDAIIPEIQKETADFICLNFANPDMVGHTGNLNAAVKACEAVDECVKDKIEEALKKDYKSIIISDHGNCEKMENEDGTPNTAHTINPVPIILVDNEKRKIGNGILANIAPTILELMGINKPLLMDKDSLIIK